MILTEQKRLQILSYIVHAGEILQKDNHLPQKSYRYWYLPAWSELYTWALKAAWYLFIDKNINNIVFITQQTKYSDEIVWYWEEDFLIRWRTIKNNSNKITKKQIPITLELFDQLLYARLLTQLTSVTILWIWENIPLQEIKEFIKGFKGSDQWIIMIWKASENYVSSTKDEDIEMIQHILNKKTYKKNLKRLGNIYKDLVKNKKKEPELVVYVNSSDLWIKTKQQIWYICMVA